MILKSADNNFFDTTLERSTILTNGMKNYLVQKL